MRQVAFWPGNKEFRIERDPAVRARHAAVDAGLGAVVQRPRIGGGERLAAGVGARAHRLVVELAGARVAVGHP